MPDTVVFLGGSRGKTDTDGANAKCWDLIIMNKDLTNILKYKKKANKP